ncbi:addiction module toxin, HicA family [Desulfosporosinus fructosivorans]|uniref:Addiction module toxin, HicA family n=1 Tax=Desulfosporosinus fructosivorans TaxID=2018669 RepID=A0A4Z0R1A9_9FIRM|nr:type II toxin-antitoxin system HicA family toxin [Desulfosporosinus fructosivorans]TGE36842.1 addiction module toxin, HicA family [Desulfosporosinus fructosivorans]
MTRLPRVEGKNVVAALKRADFRVSHIRGSHHYLRRSSGNLVCVPVHSGITVDLKTLKSILEQAELTIDELIELL